MLVLGRSKRQSVVIGDEITVTVEDIRDGSSGQLIFGATAHLGFESPRYVSIYRSELHRLKTSRLGPGVAATPQAPSRSGEIVQVSNAQVRLRIQVPRRVPVRHNGSASVRSCSDESASETGNSTAVYHVTCNKDDRIEICRNIIIAALGVRRLVADERSPA